MSDLFLFLDKILACDFNALNVALRVIFLAAMNTFLPFFFGDGCSFDCNWTLSLPLSVKQTIMILRMYRGDSVIVTDGG